jgi:hypothetical protein
VGTMPRSRSPTVHPKPLQLKSVGTMPRSRSPTCPPKKTRPPPFCVFPARGCPPWRQSDEFKQNAAMAEAKRIATLPRRSMPIAPPRCRCCTRGPRQPRGAPPPRKASASQVADGAIAISDSE